MLITSLMYIILYYMNIFNVQFQVRFLSSLFAFLDFHNIAYVQLFFWLPQHLLFHQKHFPLNYNSLAKYLVHFLPSQLRLCEIPRLEFPHLARRSLPGNCHLR